MSEHHGGYMRLALEQAQRAGQAGNRAVGAVIVRNGVVVGKGGNRRESATDPVGHAEVTALRDAVGNLGGLDFAGCTLYTTLEPCPMCAGAIAVNNIPRVIVGKMHGSQDRRWGDYDVHKVLDMVGQGTQVQSGVLEDECAAVLNEWDIKNGRVPVS